MSHSDDPQRPRFHFLPPRNWMNDPNGFIQFRGRYHLFYQHNPFGPLWGSMHWGHAVSDDLVHWEHLPLALAPTPGSPDREGVFSGCAVDDNGTLTLLYTGNGHYAQQQCLAVAHDDLVTFEKYAHNPVISGMPPEAGDHTDLRDPFVWREADGWYMALGSRIGDVGGAVFLYHSDDLRRWQYLHPLFASSAPRHRLMWECPNFFQTGDHWVLIISSHTGTTTDLVLYFVGRYEGHRFIPLAEGVLDYGVLYAPLTTLDDHGQRLMIGWTRETWPDAEQVRVGWSGAQCIPRVVSVDEQMRLLMQPIAAVETLRQGRHSLGLLAQPASLPLGGCARALDIVAVFHPGAGAAILSVVMLEDIEEQVIIRYEARSQTLTVACHYRSGSPLIRAAASAPHALLPHEPLTLRVLLDGSVVEMIANQRTSITQRFYARSAAVASVEVALDGAGLQQLDVWEMAAG
jgi:beta-fructofuranosidase